MYQHQTRQQRLAGEYVPLALKHEEECWLRSTGPTRCAATCRERSTTGDADRVEGPDHSRGVLRRLALRGERWPYRHRCVRTEIAVVRTPKTLSILAEQGGG